MNEELAREAFNRIFAAYELSEGDIAWRIFLAGWEARSLISTEEDLIRLNQYPRRRQYDA